MHTQGSSEECELCVCVCVCVCVCEREREEGGAICLGSVLPDMHLFKLASVMRGGAIWEAFLLQSTHCQASFTSDKDL